jgi:hypothetical protein
MKKILLFSLLLTICLLQFSCKKKDNDPAPAAVDQNAGLKQNGSISGTINTSSANSTTENFSYNFPYSAGPNIYDGSSSTVNFFYGKSFDGLISGLDQTTGSFTFGAADSTKSAPTSWTFSLSATNPNATGTFLFSTGGPNNYNNTNDITEANSNISGYSFTNNTMSFKITTHAYFGSNGKDAIVTTNFNLPIVNVLLRTAVK